LRKKGAYLHNFPQKRRLRGEIVPLQKRIQKQEGRMTGRKKRETLCFFDFEEKKGKNKGEPPEG